MAGPTRGESLVLLAVLGAGVFLAGLELMITAVALPAIVADLASWTRLREASWVINGYLLAYVVAMPLAGRLTDIVGARRLFPAALALFTVGSGLAGAAPSLEALIVARLVQAAGGGALVPVATAAASHLFPGPAQPRALGVVGALTFLGMAAGPALGALILEAVHPDAALAFLGVDAASPLTAALVPGWRWVFYVNVPIGLVVLVVAWAASAGWEERRRTGRVDVVGATLFSIALASMLGSLTLLGSRPGDRSSLIGGGAAAGGGAPAAGGGAGVPGTVALPDPGVLVAGLAVLALVAGVLAVWRGLRVRDPFLDPRLFRSPAFAAAALVSLLTGYGLATALVGAAVFVDRVLYGGPAEQRVALGTLAAATAAGALVSGFVVRVVSLRVTGLVGLAASIGGLALMATWTPETSLAAATAPLALFGAGFGLTVTPRSTAAVAAVAPSAYGAASSVVTVARMAGMAVGLAVLTAYGSTTIDRLYDQVYASPTAYRQFVPEPLRDRPLRDGQVVDALEAWASAEAAQIMVGVFLAAALVTAVAVPPTLLLDRRRILGPAGAGDDAVEGAARDDADAPSGMETDGD